MDSLYERWGETGSYNSMVGVKSVVFNPSIDESEVVLEIFEVA